MKTHWLLFLLLVLAIQLPGLAQGDARPAGETGAAASSPLSATSDGLHFGRRQILTLFTGLAGVPMWSLVVCGFLVMSFTVERMVVLQKRRVTPKAFTTRFLQQLRDRELDNARAHELLSVCRNHDTPISHFFAIVVENRGCSSFEVRTAVADVAETELFPLRRHIRAIGGLAALAPLLGLFGTVIGMIDAFQALSKQTGSGKTELLASGISLALVATASGLGVAIFASISYYFLQGRVDQRVQDLDVLTNQAIALVSSDARPSPPEPKSRRVAEKVR